MFTHQVAALFCVKWGQRCHRESVHAVKSKIRLRQSIRILKRRSIRLFWRVRPSKNNKKKNKTSCWSKKSIAGPSPRCSAAVEASLAVRVVTVCRVQCHVWRALYKSRPEKLQSMSDSPAYVGDSDRCLTIWHESGPYCSTIISSIAHHRGAHCRLCRTPLDHVTWTPQGGVGCLPSSAIVRCGVFSVQ